MSEQQPKLSITFNSFTDWCNHKDSLSEATRHTVEILLDRAGTSDANEANRIISSTDLLSLEDFQISDLTPLQCFTNLTHLDLSKNQISDIAPLQYLTDLTDLNLCSNQISDISHLKFLIDLNNLDLSYNQISDIEYLQFLTHLTSLDIGKNQISDIQPLQSFNSFIHLSLQENQISDIAPLQSLTRVTYLNLSGNQISDITPLQSLKNLTSLDLSCNQISDITPLQSLTNSIVLNLSKNKISNILPVYSLSNLKYLNLSSNDRISDLTPLQSLTNLNYLFVDLTPEQKTLIAACRQKWESFVKYTGSIEHLPAAAAIQNTYAALNLKAPEIIFCDNPKEALIKLRTLKKLKNINFKHRLDKQLKDLLQNFLLIEELQQEILEVARWEEPLKHQLQSQGFKYNKYSKSMLTSKYLRETLTLAECCISILGITLKPESHKVFAAVKQLVAECGWIFAFANICIACSRPIKLCFDSANLLHAEGESAIEFAGGYKLYSYRGVTLPEKYGKLIPSQWKSQWLLEEENAELRRVLIQGIGYARICQELEATELDKWVATGGYPYQEYALLRIDADIDSFDEGGGDNDFDGEDSEPILLLKMTCPSTGFIHALRVPPDLTSAREAIRWVNWDIDPDEFSVQT
ncbi:MAG: leucine-rich repeat domain-containing protein [Oscillatoriaceae cyanobacterium Prado104]|jgi:internalin A|nr:leucine-rich repeat domain-containing protein [Oscillatoriaceae cyanobacterium Prado104]